MKRQILSAAVIAAVMALSACGSEGEKKTTVTAAQTTTTTTAATTTKPKETEPSEADTTTKKKDEDVGEIEDDITQHKFNTYNGKISYDKLVLDDLAFEMDGINYAFVCKTEPADGMASYKVYTCTDGMRWEKTDQSFKEYGSSVNDTEGPLAWRIKLDETHLFVIYANTKPGDPTPRAAVMTFDNGKVTLDKYDDLFSRFTCDGGVPFSQAGRFSSFGSMDNEDGTITIFLSSDTEDFQANVQFNPDNGVVTVYS